MTVLQEDNLVNSGVINYRNLNYLGAWSLTGSTSQPGRIVGNKRYIDSVYTGKFTPNVIRINPVTIWKGEGKMQNGTMKTATRYYTNGRWYPIGQWYDGPLLAPYVSMPSTFTWNSNLERISNAKAYAKVNSVENDLALALAEFDQTIRLIRNPFARLRKFITRTDFLDNKIYIAGLSGAGVRNASVVASMAAWKTARRNKWPLLSTDTWLLYRFGLRPFIYDITTAFKAAFDKIEEISYHMRRTRAGIKSTTSSIVDTPRTTGSWTFSTRATTELGLTSNTVLYWKARLGAPTKTGLEQVGLTMENLIPAVWERTMYSFVIDWFFYVQHWLKAIVPNPSVEFLGGCVSQKTVNKFTITQLQPSFAASDSRVEDHSCQEFVPCTYTWNHKAIVRRTNPTIPVYPGFNPSALNVTRTLDSLALLANLIQKGIRR